ncbi:MAG: hypothetical protein CM1200mP41_37330 [Gammaproteobacteria bacterium]|nr:MAG: hypothetical protein CM1200mP41_37330 [Gammaproteobacteria bacterium]
MKLRLSGVAAPICVVGLSLGATPVLAAQKVNWNVRFGVNQEHGPRYRSDV